MAKATTQQLLGEFVGTFLLVFTVGCNVLSKQAWFGAVSIACVLMVSIYALGGVSGANFNPAVSIALGISNSMKGPGMEWGQVLTYCGVQIVAGIVAAFSYAIFFWNAFYLQPAKGMATSACLCEVLYTFMLCFVVLNVAAARKNDPKCGGKMGEWFGLAIGFVIIAGGPGSGSLGAGCFNPAVAFGLDVASAGFFIGWSLVYTFMEIIGATLAVVAFKAVRPRDFGPAPYDIVSDATLGSKLTSEFLGTFILVLTVGLTVLTGSSTGAFSIAASLMCMIYALGDVSGAHFNPAVTLAIFLSKLLPEDKRQSPKEVGLYMVAQIAGGIVAAFTYALICKGKTFPLGPTPGHYWSQVMFGELIFTFVLCFVVLAVAVHPSAPVNFFGLAIGSCVTVGGFAIGSMGGGALNPAVAVGVASAQILNGGMFYKALFYSLAEFAGAALAAGVVKTTHGGKPALYQ
jgi:aquaporin Z